MTLIIVVITNFWVGIFNLMSDDIVKNLKAHRMPEGKHNFGKLLFFNNKQYKHNLILSTTFVHFTMHLFK